jgi:hypothetical protein
MKMQVYDTLIEDNHGKVADILNLMWQCAVEVAFSGS